MNVLLSLDFRVLIVIETIKYKSSQQMPARILILQFDK